jgi:hypothetical protein
VIYLGGCRDGKLTGDHQYPHTHPDRWICIPFPEQIPLDAIYDPAVPARPGWLLRHEIAHILAGAHGHTRVWEQTYLMLGGGPDLAAYRPTPREMSTARWSHHPMRHRLRG